MKLATWWIPPVLSVLVTTLVKKNSNTNHCNSKRISCAKESYVICKSGSVQCKAICASQLRAINYAAQLKCLKFVGASILAISIRATNGWRWNSVICPDRWIKSGLCLSRMKRFLYCELGLHGYLLRRISSARRKKGYLPTSLYLEQLSNRTRNLKACCFLS